MQNVIIGKIVSSEKRDIWEFSNPFTQIFYKPKTALETVYFKNLYPWTHRYLAKAGFSDHFPQEIYSSTSF